MCISPNSVWVQRGPKWEQQPVACRQCWRCRKNRVDDYVARAMAESATSSEVCVLTLTYAPRDDLADKVLQPRHFQLFMKLLRRRGHKVRYLVAGEYGSLKDRAHFHAILFFTKLVGARRAADYNADHLADPETSAPFSREIPQKRMCHIREWPHGHVTADWSRSEAAIRYVCKYLLADDKKSAWFSLSKKPPLGAAWFAEKAEKAREYGVLPRTFEYLPPGGDRARPYLMTGATRRDYLAAITTDPADTPKMSEWTRKTFDKHHLAREIAWREDYAKRCPLGALYRVKQNLDAHRISVAAMDERLALDDAFRVYASAIGWDAALAKIWGMQDAQEFEGYAEQRRRQGQWLDGSPRRDAG